MIDKKANQALLNRLVPLLRTQGKKSTNDAGECQYRGEVPGCKCLIGHGISDSEYHLGFEGEAIRNFRVQQALIKSNLDLGLTMYSLDVNMFTLAQDAHDSSGDNLEGFEARLEIVCKECGYEVPEIV